jgi:hypothetical protein
MSSMKSSNAVVTGPALDEDLASPMVDPWVNVLGSDRGFDDLLLRVGLANATNRRTLEAASGGRPLLNLTQSHASR